MVAQSDTRSEIRVIELRAPTCAQQVIETLSAEAGVRCSSKPCSPECVGPGGSGPVSRPRAAADMVVLCSPASDAVEHWLANESGARPPTLAVVPDAEAEGIETLIDRGLEDFVLAPVRGGELIARVRRLLHAACPEPPDAEVRSRMSSGQMVPPDLRRRLIGRSPVFEAVLASIPKLAASDATVLVSGETGTGKELVARALHYHSPRRSGPFVPVNCGALPENLVENELFGHGAGAFTDARGSSRGLIAAAEGGTLFLDELDALPLPAQAKLLRFLQDQRYRPLGESRSRHADVRVVAASNCDLERAIRERRFRRDLFHRLDVLRLALPPLRLRLGDISRLARHFLGRYRSTYGKGPRGFTMAALARLGRYDWPGNVRELESVIHRAVVLGDEDMVRSADLDLPNDPARGGHDGPLEGDRQTLAEAKRRLVDRFERRYLIDSLEAASGNVSQAARQAGKERSAFQRLLRKHGIDRKRFVPRPF